jgi:uncharacterized protein YbbC (DUF1343 family)
MKQTLVKILLFSVVIFLIVSSKSNEQPIARQKNLSSFKLGNENLLSENIALISGKNVGIITNNSGILSEGTSIVDAMLQLNKEKINVTKIFSPEHGFRGDDNDNNHVDSKTGIEIVTLYGNKKKPSSNDLSNVDVLVYDIQDVGTRFYTFINTMYYCMEAAVENNKQIVICDRPIIQNPEYIDGFMLSNEVKSFVGMLPISVVYGLTCGELANYLNAVEFSGKCDLQISKMSGYSRTTEYTSLNLAWAKPSPSMYSPSTAVAYAGTCLLEGTNFAEGRGTDKPFEYVGAPYCDGNVLKAEMDSYGFTGVEFTAIQFAPTSITSPSNPPKFVGENCSGVYINITDKKIAEPFKIGVALLISLNKLFPKFKIRDDKFLDKLSGTRELRKMILDGKDLNYIVSTYQTSLSEYKSSISLYFLY